MPRDIGGGVMAETVGDLLGDSPPPPVQRVEPPRLEGAPAMPEPGLYFGMPSETYHAIHALSTSGIKHLSVSSMDYWAHSPLNPDRNSERKDYFDFGNAIHTLVLEGEDVYRDRYVIGLSKGDFPDLLETTEQIKEAIVQAGAKPITKTDEGRSAKKDDWCAQLLDLDPAAQIWERIKAAFEAEHEGAEIISHDIDRRVRIATRMIEAHPEISLAVKGGYPEVSAFWYCPTTGCPMKARFDYLKPGLVVDLKSISGKSNEPVDQQITKAIANFRYMIQHAVYVEAAMQAAQLIRSTEGACIYGGEEERAWASSWARGLTEEPAFLFIFQKSGIAPVTRGKVMPRETYYSVAQRRVEDLKRRWIANCEVYGADLWLDLRPIEHLDDSDFPLWVVDF